MKGNIIMWPFIIVGIFLLLLAINPDLPRRMTEGWANLTDQLWAPFTPTKHTITPLTPEPTPIANGTKVILPVPSYP